MRTSTYTLAIAISGSVLVHPIAASAQAEAMATDATMSAMSIEMSRQAQESYKGPPRATPTCVPASPLPTGPGAGSESVAFNGAWSTGKTFTGTFWRQSCDATTTYLYLRLSPATGTPFVCGSGMTAIVSGSQYEVRLTKALGASSFCADLFIPTTFLVEQRSFNPKYDVNSAITLIYMGETVQTTAKLPAKGASTTPPPSTGSGAVDAIEYVHAEFGHRFITAHHRLAMVWAMTVNDPVLPLGSRGSRR